MIVVNGSHFVFEGDEISYEQLLKLLGIKNNGVYTVVYTRGINGTKGSLNKGESIEVANGMRFNVDITVNG